MEEAFSIPTGYGGDRIVLLVKDPWWLYAYWEITPGMERATRSQLLPHEVPGLQSVLRVYDVTEADRASAAAPVSPDIPLSGLATSWYIQVNAPNRSFVVEIGLLTRPGRFLAMARSNRVTTPRFGPSEVIDEAWRITDETFWKLLGQTGIGMGASPMEWAKLLQRLPASGQWSSGGLMGQGRPSVVRGFWCRVNADLIIHGAVEPKALVTVEGQPVAVRKDGTFSLRLALPRGTQTLTIEVAAPDGRCTRSVTPMVSLAWSGSISQDATSAKERVMRDQPSTVEPITGEPR